MTPISSLQNVLAVSYLEQAGMPISFGKWICVSLPFCTISTVLAWLFLLVVLKPDDITSIPIIVYERGKAFGKRDATVTLLSILTLVMFASFNYFKSFFGDIAIIASLFVTFMYGSGILSDVDFNSLSWHTLFLVGGGNVLGKAIASSGLLGYLSDGITSGMNITSPSPICFLLNKLANLLSSIVLPLTSPWWAMMTILLFTGTVATFVSHTVASLILTPIIINIGITLGIPEKVVIGAAFAGKIDGV